MAKTDQLYYRDLGPGDSGEDVARAQRLLLELGYQISEDEKRKQQYGQSTAEAVQKLRGDLSNPLVILKLLFDLLTGKSDSLEALLQVSAEDLEDEFIAPDGKPAKGAFFGFGGADDALGTGRALKIGRTEQRNLDALKAFGDGLKSSDTAARTAELAERFLGQHEQGGNAGAIVQLVNGYAGDPWCGGFAHYVFQQTMPGVYNQANFRSARSYVEEGKKFGAFHARGSDYVPGIGDAIMFQRTGDPAKGHVGIVVGYNPQTHELRYIAGNDGNAVRERVIDLDEPPSRLLGFTDSHALAKAKGIDVTKAPVPAPPAEKDFALAHNAPAKAEAKHEQLFKTLQLPSLPGMKEVAQTGEHVKHGVSVAFSQVKTAIGKIHLG